MTSRSRQSSRATKISKGPRHESLQLKDRLQTSLRREHDADGITKLNASSLQKHPYEDQDLEFVDQQNNNPNVLRRLLAFMSLTPLLGAKANTHGHTKYGALPAQDPGSESDQSSSEGSTDRDEHHAIQIGNAAFRTAESSANSRSRRRRNEGASWPPNRVQDLEVRNSKSTKSGQVFAHGQSKGSGSPSPDCESLVDGDETISINEEDSGDPADNSQYPQVRASVAATDNPSLSINTPRMWILSMICAFLGSATNLFFSLRYPSVSITPVIALVVVHPLGRLWDRTFKHDDDPDETFEDGVLTSRGKSQDFARNRGKRARLRLWLAQGSWNGKEHACVYVSSNVSFGFAFATDVIVEQSKFYHQDVNVIYQLLLTISTQILGYAFAGLTRRFLVRPPSMIWPGILMSTAMFTTMHSSENKSANEWKISRWNFFVVVWAGAFAWYFLPGLLIPALSHFNVITWFAPKNVVIANLVGVWVPSRLCFADVASLVFLPGSDSFL